MKYRLSSIYRTLEISQPLGLIVDKFPTPLYIAVRYVMKTKIQK